MDWNGKRVLVTGGASFIGSHLVDALVEKNANVRVVDNLSSGRIENLEKHQKSASIDFILGDLLDAEVAREVLQNMEIVFHLAADHGGRGYVDLHQVACSTNLGLDSQFFKLCEEMAIEQITYASSGCVYPNFKQTDVEEELYLTEQDVGPPYDSDNLYGWAKLMAEMTLRAYHKERGMKTASVRYFTVYGERGKEDHAVIAMIAKAFIQQDPFEIWGDGNQIRNWTYVKDIAEGTILAAEKIEDGTAINLGTTERIRVTDAAKDTIRFVREHCYPDYNPKLKFLTDMPTGPVNRVASNDLAKSLLDWKPRMKFFDGLHRTIDWYLKCKNVDTVKEIVAGKLTER